ncbi:unnamed protein product [Lymnaea stagnalis]|uniref:EGF-like domain-containing protein n=1 Tax=Lymnaea stagnalis TaxID=6523 RepID=A0AAV2ILR7_LYMST
MKDYNASTFSQWRTKMSQPIVFYIYLRLKIISMTVFCSLGMTTSVMNATDAYSGFMNATDVYSGTPKTCDDIICDNNNICQLSLVNGTQRNDAQCVCLGQWAGLRCEAKLYLSLRTISSDSVSFEVKGMKARPPVEHFSFQELHITDMTLVIWNLNRSDHCLILQQTEIQSPFHVHGLQRGQGYVVCTANGVFESCSVFDETNLTFQSNCLHFETIASEPNPLNFGAALFSCVLSFFIFIAICYMYSKRHTLLVQFILNIFCFRNCYCLRRYGKRRRQPMRRQREISSEILMPPEFAIDFSSSSGLFASSYRPGVSSRAMSSKASSSGSRRSAFSMDASFTSATDPIGFLYENQSLIKPIYSSQSSDILKLTYLEEDLLPLSCDHSASSSTMTIPVTFSDVEFYSKLHSFQHVGSTEFSSLGQPLNGPQSFQNVNHYKGAHHHSEYSQNPHNHREYSQNPHNHRKYSQNHHNHCEYSQNPHNHREYSQNPHNHREYSQNPHNHREYSQNPHNHREYSQNPHNHCENSQNPHNHCENSQYPVKIKIYKHPEMNSEVATCSGGKSFQKEHLKNRHHVKQLTINRSTVNYQRPDPLDHMETKDPLDHRETKDLRCFNGHNNPLNTNCYYNSCLNQNSEDKFLKNPVHIGVNGYHFSSFHHSSTDRNSRKANSSGGCDRIITDNHYNHDNDDRFSGNSTLPRSRKPKFKKCFPNTDDCNLDQSYTLPRDWKTPVSGKGPMRPTYLDIIPSTQMFPVVKAMTQSSTLVTVAQPKTYNWHVKNLISQFENLHFFKQNKSNRCTGEEEEFLELQSPLAEDRSRMSKKRHGSNLSWASARSPNSLTSLKRNSCKNSPVFEGHPSEHFIPPFSLQDECETDIVGSLNVSDTEDMSFMSMVAQANGSVLSCFDDDSSNLVTPFHSGGLSDSDDDTYKDVTSLTGSVDTLRDYLTEPMTIVNTFESTSRWKTSQSSDDFNKHSS